MTAQAPETMFYIDVSVYTKPSFTDGLFKETAKKVQQNFLSLGDWFMHMPDYDLDSLFLLCHNITDTTGVVSEQEALLCTTAIANMASILLVGQGENLVTQRVINDAATMLVRYIVLEAGLRASLSDVELAAIRKRYSLDSFDAKFYDGVK